MDSANSNCLLQQLGFPIRTSPDRRSLTAPRGISSFATSFFGSWRLGILRALFVTYPVAHRHSSFRSARFALRFVSPRTSGKAESHSMTNAVRCAFLDVRFAIQFSRNNLLEGLRLQNRTRVIMPQSEFELRFPREAQLMLPKYVSLRKRHSP